MKRFVVVEASPLLDVLHARCSDTSFDVRLSLADRVHGTSVIDEHLVVDVDACQNAYLLACADVLQGSQAHSVADALHRLMELVSVHPSCGIAAVSLAGDGAGGANGWAVASGSDRSVVLVPYDPQGPHQVSAERSLLPSCLHAWLVAGRSLREWPYAHDAPSI